MCTRVSSRGLRHRLAWAPLLLAALACGSPSDPLPEGMVGIWRNPAPGYAENYFEIRTDAILFGLEKYEFNLHAIASVQAEPSDGHTDIRIEYTTNNGETAPLLLVFIPGDPPRLRIGARPEQWIPEEHASWLKKEAS
jgi:hypothetical protein